MCSSDLGRTLAPELFELNRQGAWNGHIPVTAVNSAIMVLAALVQGVDQVVFSNERSVSYGSQIAGTGEVNHQWSKGWAFEKAFGEYVQQHIAADLNYYSLLRPLSELAVARQFAKTDFYDAHFSSCNRNFHILGERPVNRWCGVCPKCHFVFLALAPFMPKTRLVRIFEASAFLVSFCAFISCSICQAITRFTAVAAASSSLASSARKSSRLLPTCFLLMTHSLPCRDGSLRDSVRRYR